MLVNGPANPKLSRPQVCGACRGLRRLCARRPARKRVTRCRRQAGPRRRAGLAVAVGAAPRKTTGVMGYHTMGPLCKLERPTAGKAPPPTQRLPPPAPASLLLACHPTMATLGPRTHRLGASSTGHGQATGSAPAALPAPAAALGGRRALAAGGTPRHDST